MTASHDEGGLTTFYVPGATAAWLTNRASVVLGPSAPPGGPLRWPWDLWFLSSFRAPNEVICNPVEDASGDLLWWDDADRVAAYVADRLSERYTLTVPGYLNPEYAAEWELKEKP